MRAIVIVEGIDCSGKTSFCQELTKPINAELYAALAVVHYNKGKPVKVALFSHEYMDYLRNR